MPSETLQNDLSEQSQNIKNPERMYPEVTRVFIDESGYLCVDIGTLAYRFADALHQIDIPAQTIHGNNKTSILASEISDITDIVPPHTNTEEDIQYNLSNFAHSLRQATILGEEKTTTTEDIPWDGEAIQTPVTVLAADINNLLSNLAFLAEQEIREGNAKNGGDDFEYEE